MAQLKTQNNAQKNLKILQNYADTLCGCGGGICEGVGAVGVVFGAQRGGLPTVGSGAQKGGTLAHPGRMFNLNGVSVGLPWAQEASLTKAHSTLAPAAMAAGSPGWGQLLWPWPELPHLLPQWVPGGPNSPQA